MSQYSSLCHNTDQANGNGILSRHLKTPLRCKEMKIPEELYRDKRNLCHGRKWQNNEISQDNVPVIEFSMLRQAFQLMKRPRKIICHDKRKLTQHLELAMKDKKCDTPKEMNDRHK